MLQGISCQLYIHYLELYIHTTSTLRAPGFWIGNCGSRFTAGFGFPLVTWVTRALVS